MVLGALRVERLTPDSTTPRKEMETLGAPPTPVIAIIRALPDPIPYRVEIITAHWEL